MRTRRGIQFCKSATCPHIPEPVRNLSLSLPDCFLGHSCSQYKGNNDPYTCPRTECRNDIICFRNLSWSCLRSSGRPPLEGCHSAILPYGRESLICGRISAIGQQKTFVAVSDSQSLSLERIFQPRENLRYRRSSITRRRLSNFVLPYGRALSHSGEILRSWACAPTVYGAHEIGNDLTQYIGR